MLHNPLDKRRRILFLDLVRGLAVLNMIAYHLLYDLVYIFDVEIPWFSIRKCYMWEQLICFTFILVSGIAFRLSKEPWKNGIKLLVCAMMLTVVTGLVIPEEIIRFGILHFLGCAILLVWLVRPLLDKIHTHTGVMISLLLFGIIKNLPQGRLGIAGFWSVRLPERMYGNDYLYWLGFPTENFFSADYFPLLPWILLFIAGYFAGVWWIRASEWMDGCKVPCGNTAAYKILDASLGWVGRKSLWIYMLHQPVIYGILLLIYHKY